MSSRRRSRRRTTRDRGERAAPSSASSAFAACYHLARMTRILAALIASVLVSACVARDAAQVRAVDGARPIVVQGAMDVEVKKLAGSLDHVTEEQVEGWTFWRGTIDGYPVVVSKTLKGMSNAAAAT